ncbi:MAG TPA: type II toxin-antitoxin system RelE/ParE family toxin [Gammaproteobacteria bacterium]|nr:type II toxin-antitoxin system RelE/ParE family toxin [Gammaproteobacteria bacterium]
MKIIWSPLAVERTSEIAEYISIDNPSAAVAWVEKLFEKVDLLKLSPETGRKVPEISRKEIKEILFGNYRIIYRIEKTKISILTIRHGKQILPVDEILETN